MAEDFNPYHVWLSIPPEEQPPNHYRLLGLRLFETSGDVIDGAADRQMAHLRTFQGGKHGDLTQRLLNELAAARVCLLDAKKRAAYDRQLREKLSPGVSPSSAGQPKTQSAAVAAATIPRVAAQSPTADKWDDLLGNGGAKPLPHSASRSNRRMSLGIAGALLLAAGIGYGVLSFTISSAGTLVFDWPEADRTDMSVAVDEVPLVVPPSGPWEYRCPRGPHHIVGQQPAFKLDISISVVAGQRETVPPDWKAKAVLVFDWPQELRSGAKWKVDGRQHSISPLQPLELPVEPGRHLVQVTWPGGAPFVATVVVAAEGRELISVRAPPTDAKLVFDWPIAERKEAQVTLDGQIATISSASGGTAPELTLKPGRHSVHITRPGFVPFNQVVELSAGANSLLKPTWTPEKNAAVLAPESPAAVPPVVANPVPVETAQPAKKLAIPTAAEQARIAKQLDELYKLGPGQTAAKDPSTAQKLYDLAANGGSIPAERYMLLLRGAEIAAAGGDLILSLQGIDALDNDYEINALDAKQKLLEKFVNASKPNQVAIAIPAVEGLVDQAIAADQFEIAFLMVNTASRAVVKSQIATRKEEEERLSRRRRDIHLLQPIFASAKKAKEALDKNPTDPEANLICGRWRCLYKRDWSAGLPLLAKGSDEKLKSFAAQELNPKTPNDVEQEVRLAEAWWDLAQKETGFARDSLHLHAGEIYQEALPNLTSVLKIAAIEKRLKEIASLDSDHPALANKSRKDSGPDRWIKAVAALPAEKQVEAVVKKLQQLNSDFDGSVTQKIEGGVVTEFTLATDNVTDISPVRALAGLKNLKCAGSGPGKGILSDLSPLKGMPLTFLDCGWTKVSDLSPLQGMHLTVFQCGSTSVSDLSPLKNMPLTFLDCGGTQVSDLSPLKGMPLTRLICAPMRLTDLSPLRGMPLRSLNCSQNHQLSDLSPLKGMSLTELFCNDTSVSDLSPLKGMPLRCLYCDKTRITDLSPLEGLELTEVALTPQQVRVGLDVLRRMPSLQKLRRNAWDASATPDEFWRRYDAGEFGK